MSQAHHDLHDDPADLRDDDVRHAPAGPVPTAQDIARRFRKAEPTAEMLALRALLERQAQRAAP